MRPSHGTRPRRKAARTGSFYRRAGVTCVLLVSSWTVVYYRGDIPALLQSPAISRNELKVPNGSLLFSPFSDNTCRQSLIDNATGRIRDNGFVDCEVAKSPKCERVGHTNGHKTCDGRPRFVCEQVTNSHCRTPRSRRSAAIASCAPMGGRPKPLSKGEIAARFRGYQPTSAETSRAWEYWAHRAGCADMIAEPHGHKSKI